MFFFWFTLKLKNLFVLSALTHRPASSFGGHVTVDLESCGVVQRKHGVNTIFSLTTGVQIATVAGAGAWGKERARGH